MRVAANHFVVNGVDDVLDVETALFPGDLCVEEYLKKEVAEFFGEFSVVSGIECVEDFVGFFDQIGAQGSVSLFAVPGAAVGGAQTGHDGDEFLEGGAYGDRFGCKAAPWLAFAKFFWHGEIIQSDQRSANSDKLTRRKSSRQSGLRFHGENGDFLRGGLPSVVDYTWIVAAGLPLWRFTVALGSRTAK